MPWGPLSYSSWGLPSWVCPGGIHAWCFIPKLRAATLGVTQQGCTPRAALHGAVHWVNLGKSLLVLCHSNKKWSVQPNGVSIATGKNEKLGQKTQEGIAVVPHPLGCRDDKNFEGLLFRGWEEVNLLSCKNFYKGIPQSSVGYPSPFLPSQRGPSPT